MITSAPPQAAARDRTIRLRIGNKHYDVTVTDNYLRQTRIGARHVIQHALRRLIGREGFEPRMVKLFSSLVRTQDQVLDIGANIGCTTLLFSDLGNHVHAFEPVPETFRLLAKNVKASGKVNVSPHNFALGRESKVSGMAYSEENRSGAFIADKENVQDSSKDVVAVKRLDDVWTDLSLLGLDFLKIDVEGYEINVIDGAWHTIQRYKPLIELEMNSWCLNVMQRTSLPDFLDFITQRFPYAYAVDGETYVNIHDSSGRWLVMRENVLNQRFRELVLGFDADRLAKFKQTYQLRVTQG